MYVIAYDIISSRRRTQLAKVLSAYGERIQKSVFALAITERQVVELLAKVQPILDGRTDSLHVYRLNKDAIKLLGISGQTLPNAQRIVII